MTFIDDARVTKRHNGADEVMHDEVSFYFSVTDFFVFFYTFLQKQVSRSSALPTLRTQSVTLDGHGIVGHV